MIPDYIPDPKSKAEDVVREATPVEGVDLPCGCRIRVLHQHGERVFVCSHMRKWAVKANTTVVYSARQVQ